MDKMDTCNILNILCSESAVELNMRLTETIKNNLTILLKQFKTI